jgi:hypothetical protein
MNTPGKLKAISEELGEPLESLIPRVISEEGSILQTAVRLGVAPNTIQNWLKNNGYRIETRQVATLVKEPDHANG